eukprot:TRINITY_DN17857_c0_g1_i1.p1 TRINITY_DN17857_c0_g1~~TRINITY_DN17857_c0_g1_i1.p1  ORF type:complete len:266 (+),score=85.57 TRINITY_DN17857_c0_g1_i1:98-895(+)
MSDEDDDMPLAKRPSLKTKGKDSKPSNPKRSSSKPVVKKAPPPKANVKKEVKQIEKVKAPPVKKKKVDTDKAEKRERKTFDLPGQTKEVPEERDPMRIFYESLHTQRPDSDMALFWLMEHGLLPEEEARKALERKQKMRTGAKGASKVSNGGASSSASPLKKTVRKVEAAPPRSNGIKNAPPPKKVKKEDLDDNQGSRKAPPAKKAKKEEVDDDRINGNRKTPKPQLKPVKRDWDDDNSDEDGDDDKDDEDFKVAKKKPRSIPRK